ncbi:MAG: hypothetical protein MRY64_02960 [Hyphomonadaceae bacterium]|nr:hypothetical protein [Hyphomonadaceae bacterium]
MTRKTSLILVLCALTGACASHDYRNVDLLGDATDKNIALQSVRDVAAPNYKAIEGGEGGSSAQAVAALRGEKANP